MTYKLIGRIWKNPCPNCGSEKREVIAKGNDGLTVIIGCPICGKMCRNIFNKEYLGEEKEE